MEGAPSVALRQRNRRLFLSMLRELRMQRGLTQTDVGRKLGRKQGFVSKYETGERRLAFLDLVLVCDALEVSIIEFVKRFDHERRKPAGDADSAVADMTGRVSRSVRDRKSK